MAASLATQYYQLGKYAPTDLTDYLTTYNGTMDKIDAAIHAAQDAADTAQAQADANLNNIASLSQGLNATNKNVENLGKTQTAQGIEIDNLKDEVGKIEIMENFMEIQMTCPHGNSCVLYARRLANKIQGYAVAKITAGTISSDRNYDDSNLIDLGYYAGNVFGLTDFERAQCIKYESSTFKGVDEAVIFYDTATNYTRLCLRIYSSSSLTLENDTFYSPKF